MRRLKYMLAASAGAVLLMSAGSAGAAANENASCVGIAPSGAAGFPGLTASAVQTFREIFGSLGPFLSDKAQLHPGSFEGCGFPLPPPS
jgi:hypothetical protein